MASPASPQKCISVVYQPIVPCVSALLLCAWAAIELCRPRTTAKIQAIKVANAKLVGHSLRRALIVVHTSDDDIDYFCFPRARPRRSSVLVHPGLRRKRSHCRCTRCRIVGGR